MNKIFKLTGAKISDLVGTVDSQETKQLNQSDTKNSIQFEPVKVLTPPLLHLA